jgi:benzoyl-CoA reductase/2-hydroxyglutaryl-CoA dehydratase subunit BcrC/BadD/HgdB
LTKRFIYGSDLRVDVGEQFIGINSVSVVTLVEEVEEFIRRGRVCETQNSWMNENEYTPV